MSTKCFSSLVLCLVFFTFSTFGQGTVLVYDPTKEPSEPKLTGDIKSVFDSAMTTVMRFVPEADCVAEIDATGLATGSFTAAGKSQTLIFYQYCQTGNGFGKAGLVLIENGKTIATYVGDGGWSGDVVRVADVNGDGVDEFALAWYSGMHQGSSGTGVDIFEFSGDKLVGLGWYKASEYGPTEAANVWKLTAKRGKTPIFYAQKYFSGENRPFRKVGTAKVTKLRKDIFAKLALVK